jgi:hypothetical protein
MFHLIDTATFLDLGNKFSTGAYFRYFSSDGAVRLMHHLNRLHGYPRFFVQEIRP